MPPPTTLVAYAALVIAVFAVVTGAILSLRDGDPQQLTALLRAATALVRVLLALTHYLKEKDKR